MRSNLPRMKRENRNDFFWGRDLSVNGLTIGRGSGNVASNAVIGSGALRSNTSGSYNVANGNNALRSNTSGSYNVANGNNALLNNTSGNSNTANGSGALLNNTSGGSNTANGNNALLNNTSGNSNTANGNNALLNNTSGNSNTANGSSALQSNTTGSYNTANGNNALKSNASGSYNTANGNNALQGNTSGSYNTANGSGALYSLLGTTVTAGSFIVGATYKISLSGTTDFSLIGSANNAVGTEFVATGIGSGTGTATLNQQNTATGYNALYANSSGFNNTASGAKALNTNTIFYNCSGLGYNAQVTGSNQVQLGDANTTTYAYGAVQDRSDIRDKADVRDCTLGLDFINALRPVDFRWDMREDYRTPAPIKLEYPEKLDEQTDEEFDALKAKIDADYKTEHDKWLEASKLTNITHDGSKKRSRYHHGLIAQEVKALDFAFGGLQDHSLKGGDDVLSIGYEELHAPIIKAIQELSERVAFLEEQER